MLIIANTLAFNGGTTFIIRLSREFSKRGKRIGVLVLASDFKIEILEELKKYADVYFLKDYAKSIFRFFDRGPLSGFFPINFQSLKDVFNRHENIVHVMGGFGLLFINRFMRVTGLDLKCTVGVYHQNEFMYRGVNYLFSKRIQDIFRNLDPQAVVFFNDANKKSYSNFFSIDYSHSAIVPIGIELKKNESITYGSSKSRKIVSVGNLVKFKTYNQHIINLLPQLIAIDEEFTYDIYGDGPQISELIRLAEDRGVTKFVNFKGSIAYSDFDKTLIDSFLFVGSGTAIIEAASLGVPSLIGIESTSDPITYGFLCDIKGFSYNEINPEISTKFIYDEINWLIQKSDQWEWIAEKCKEKAKEFSMSTTVDGFIDVNRMVDTFKVIRDNNFFNFMSLLKCFIFEKIIGEKIFSERRNQGTLG